MSTLPSSPHRKPPPHLEQFVARKKKVLIADANGTSRGTLAGMLAKLGITGQQVSTAEDFVRAENLMEANTPSLVIADFDLGNGTGLGLFQSQREKNPFFRDSLFFLLTNNSEQHSAARAAEEEVDVFLMKPFTTEAFDAALLNGLQAKQEPTEYQRLIERGKGELADGKVDDALKTFQQAKSKNPLPSLACAYLGIAHESKGDLELAEGSYLQGLEYNEYHFRCLSGLHQVLMKQQRQADAYVPLLKRLRKFPWSAEEMKAGIRLAMLTRNFDDLSLLYDLFTKSVRRDEDLSKMLCAAFMTAGKLFAQKRDFKKALPLLQKSALLAGTRTSVLKDIVVILGDTGYGDKTDEFISRFAPVTHKESDYNVASYVRFDATASASKSIEKGRELISKGVHDPAVYLILIRRSKEANLAQVVDQLAHEAGRRFPELKAQFDAFVMQA